LAVKLQPDTCDCHQKTSLLAEEQHLLQQNKLQLTHTCWTVRRAHVKVSPLTECDSCWSIYSSLSYITLDNCTSRPV